MYVFSPPLAAMSNNRHTESAGMNAIIAVVVVFLVGNSTEVPNPGPGRDGNGGNGSSGSNGNGGSGCNGNGGNGNRGSGGNGNGGNGNGGSGGSGGNGNSTSSSCNCGSCRDYDSDYESESDTDSADYDSCLVMNRISPPDLIKEVCKEHFYDAIIMLFRKFRITMSEKDDLISEGQTQGAITIGSIRYNIRGLPMFEPCRYKILIEYTVEGKRCSKMCKSTKEFYQWVKKQNWPNV